ncbi:ABC transporter permease [Psychromarinibacter sp. C21-152]|uniref:ABC transporter permease n=1 Tax=Psychromarinibacter sediminicola TaxID=3033385 RepID=A0AAE3T6U5_9RHOB|nr:ABC transporter permease [Psychromarinibacter sediminicola]MDF0599632.1 ABC transporter permease [Psychromarinibacter sediminicola]
MGSYIVRRVLQMILVVFIISMVAFFVIQLPPGDFVTSYVSSIAAGDRITQDAILALRQQFGLDEPLLMQYFRWITNVLQGNFGLSFQLQRTVGDLLAERLPLTLAITIPTTIFVYAVAIPIGIYSAVKQYSVGDYLFTFVGFIGLAIPNFLLGIVLIYLSTRYFGGNVGGLFSPEFENAPWSVARVLDMSRNMALAIIIIGTSGTAATMRVMRGMLLDELSQAYVETARAKGLSEWRLIMKYPVRVAVSPVLSTVGFTLPAMISGTEITATVLNLPTTGPLLLNAVKSQDMFLAASIILILSVLTVIGTFISDLLLVWADPRIRL